MPEFKLVAYKAPAYTPISSSFHTKCKFCERVKMPGWNNAVEIEPKDNDPYCPNGGNQFLSTYNRLGFEREVDHFKSITMQMLEQVKLKEQMFYKPDNQKLVSMFTFKDSHCLPKHRARNSRDCAPDFISTMQASYPMPIPCVIKPLTVPVIPFLKNRKLKWEEECLSPNKYFDETYTEKVKDLQKIKGVRTVSYDPILKRYSDGTPDLDTKAPCYPMDYKKYE